MPEKALVLYYKYIFVQVRILDSAEYQIYAATLARLKIVKKSHCFFYMMIMRKEWKV